MKFPSFFLHPVTMLHQVKNQHYTSAVIGNINQIFGYFLCKSSDLVIASCLGFIPVFKRDRIPNSKTSASVLKNKAIRQDLMEFKGFFMCCKTGLFMLSNQLIEINSSLDCRDDLEALEPSPLYSRLCATIEGTLGFTLAKSSIALLIQDFNSSLFYGETMDISRESVLNQNRNSIDAFTRHVINSQWNSKNKRAYLGYLKKKESSLLAREKSKNQRVIKFDTEFSIHGYFALDHDNNLSFLCTENLHLNLGVLPFGFDDIVDLNSGMINQSNRCFTIRLKNKSIYFKSIITSRLINFDLNSLFKNAFESRFGVKNGVNVANRFYHLSGIII